MNFYFHDTYFEIQQILFLRSYEHRHVHDISVNNNIISMPDRTRPGITMIALTVNLVQDGCVKSATGVIITLSNVSTMVTSVGELCIIRASV